MQKLQSAVSLGTVSAVLEAILFAATCGMGVVLHLFFLMAGFKLASVLMLDLAIGLVAAYLAWCLWRSGVQHGRSGTSDFREATPPPA